MEEEEGGESEAAGYDQKFIKSKLQAEEVALGKAVNCQTWEMADRGILLLCDLGVYVEGVERLRPVTAGTKAEIVEAFRLILEEAYPDEPGGTDEAEQEAR